MKKKFRQLMSERCKDFGLTDKAIDELTELAVKGIASDASDDDINKAVDSLVPFAKAMQAEITRKTQKRTAPQEATEPLRSNGGQGDGEANGANGGQQVPEWFRSEMATFNSKLRKLEEENAALKDREARALRATKISDKARELGIPDFLMKRVALADDADIEKELTEYKQELVNNSLMPKEAAGEPASSEKAMREAAKSWAQSLPNAS